MSTPLSGASSYCTTAEFLQRVDWRSIADYCSDLSVKLTREALLTNEVLLAALQAASGKVESACTVAARYSPDDLAALTGNSAQLLKTVITGLAIWEIFQRRPEKSAELPMRTKEAESYLDRIRLGERVFGIQEVMEAGNVTNRVMDEGRWQTLNLTTNQARRFFGTRANRQ